MNDNRNSGTGGVAGAVIVIAMLGLILFFLLILKFSEFLGVDFKTGQTVFWGFVISVVIVVTCILGKRHLFFLEDACLWPFYIIPFWISLWPALDYWAAHQSIIPSSIVSSISPWTESDYSIPWWNAWYTTWGLLAGCVAFGGLMNRRQD